MSQDRLDEIGALLKAHFDAEVNAAFPRLTRSPSTDTIRFLDHFESLTEPEREARVAFTAQLSALGFLPPLLAQDRMLNMVSTEPTFLRYREAMSSPQFSMGMRYVGLRMMKAMLNDPMSVAMMNETRAKLDFVPRDDLPPVLVPDPDIDHLKPAKAPLLKKLIDKAFRDLFSKEKRKLPGGELQYIGSLQGAEVKVSIIFAGMGSQLVYGVSIPDGSKATFVSRQTYEGFWGAGYSWDMLTEENAEASIELLCDYVTQIVSLRNRVKAILDLN